jgi:hypothetical protein
MLSNFDRTPGFIVQLAVVDLGTVGARPPGPSKYPYPFCSSSANFAKTSISFCANFCAAVALSFTAARVPRKACKYSLLLTGSLASIRLF